MAGAYSPAIKRKQQRKKHPALSPAHSLQIESINMKHLGIDRQLTLQRVMFATSMTYPDISISIKNFFLADTLVSNVNSGYSTHKTMA